MIKFKVKLIKIGNSLGFIFPEEFVRKENMKINKKIKIIKYEDGYLLFV